MLHDSCNMINVHLCKSIKTFDLFIYILLLFWLFRRYISSSDCIHLLIRKYLQKIAYLFIALFHFSMLCSWDSPFESALGHNSPKWVILTHFKALRLINKMKKALFWKEIFWIGKLFIRTFLRRAGRRAWRSVQFFNAQGLTFIVPKSWNSIVFT